MSMFAHGGEVGMYDTVANWGETHQTGPEPERPDLPAGPPPEGYRGRRRRPVPRWVRVLIVSGLIALLIGVVVASVGVAVTLARATDPGIEFCEAIRDQEQGTTSTASGASWTFEEYQHAREALSGSRHEEIRVPALALVDVIWQFEQLGDDAGLEALPLVSSLTDSYGSLSGGCAQHGVQLPPLETLS